MTNEQNARAAALAIVKDLSGRRGLRQEWEEIDRSLRAEIVDIWTGIILSALQGNIAPQTRKVSLTINALDEYAIRSLLTALAGDRYDEDAD